jgi:Mn2+/Fe2+ NRAMP family transporter
MLKKNLSDYTNEELIKREKTTTILTYMLAGSILLLFILNIINKKRVVSSMAVPFALLPIVMLNSKSLKDIKKELKNRNLS